MIIFILLGIIASIFQLVALREFSFSIAKNELAFVVAAGFWIISCALGSIVSPKRRIKDLLLTILACIVFSASILLIHLSKSLIGLKYYEETSLNIILFLSLALIGPPAFIIGFIFRHFFQKYTRNNPPQENIYAKFFAFEAIGFFIGGIAFTFYLSNYINPLIFSILPLILLPRIKNLFKKALSAVLIIAITIISAASFNSVLKKEFNNADRLLSIGSCYGPIIAATKAGVTTLFSAGSLLATSEDKSTVEEFIHMSLSAADPSANKDILFIGAAVSGQAEEIIKYKLNSLDCLQINPLISKMAEKSPAARNNKVNFITNDPRLYLKNTNKQYDAILMNMPAPSNLALNRYFTEEFFNLIISRLKTNGIFSFNIPSKREILSPQYIKFDSSIINAIDKVFPNRFIIPSDSMIIIASNKQKITDSYLLDNFAKTNPQTAFFTIYHFKDYLDPSIRDYTENMLNKKTPANTGLNPSGFLNYLILEQNKFYPNLKIDFKKTRSAVILFLLTCGIAIITASFLSKNGACLLNTAAIGFTSISLSLIIFVLFQIYCGALFWKLGLLIALFMAGISIGTFLINRLINNHRANLLSGIYLLWIIVIFILFLNLKIIGNFNYADFIFYLYSLICGFLTGSSYPILARDMLNNKFKNENITIAIYSADLTGAFIGTLACGIILIPLLGIPNSLLTLIFLNAILALLIPTLKKGD